MLSCYWGKCCSARRDYTLWSEPKGSTNYGHGNLFFFQFVSSPIVWYLAVTQDQSGPKLNLWHPWSHSRRIVKERRVTRLLPQSRCGWMMNRKGSSSHSLKAHLQLAGRPFLFFFMEIRIAYRSDRTIWISFLAWFSYLKLFPRDAMPLSWKWAFKSECQNISRISNQFSKMEFWFIPPKQPFGMVI